MARSWVYELVARYRAERDIAFELILEVRRGLVAQAWMLDPRPLHGRSSTVTA